MNTYYCVLFALASCIEIIQARVAYGTETINIETKEVPSFFSTYRNGYVSGSRTQQQDSFHFSGGRIGGGIIGGRGAINIEEGNNVRVPLTGDGSSVGGGCGTAGGCVIVGGCDFPGEIKCSDSSKFVGGTSQGSFATTNLNTDGNRDAISKGSSKDVSVGAVKIDGQYQDFLHKVSGGVGHVSTGGGILSIEEKENAKGYQDSIPNLGDKFTGGSIKSEEERYHQNTGITQNGYGLGTDIKGGAIEGSNYQESSHIAGGGGKLSITGGIVKVERNFGLASGSSGCSASNVCVHKVSDGGSGFEDSLHGSGRGQVSATGGAVQFEKGHSALGGSNNLLISGGGIQGRVRDSSYYDSGIVAGRGGHASIGGGEITIERRRPGFLRRLFGRQNDLSISISGGKLQAGAGIVIN